jgi:hypothetical protein
MSSPLSNIASVPLSDHELVIFYEADAAIGPELKLGRLASAPAAWLPKDQVPALAGRYKDDPVWAPDKKRHAGSDFHDHIRKLIGGDRDDLLTFWTPSVHTARFLKSGGLYEESVDWKTSRVSKRLQLTLSDAATKRLADHGIKVAPLNITVISLTLASFKTSYGFACAAVYFKRLDGAPLNALEFVEAQVAISRLNQIAWIDAKTGATISDSRFTLGQVIRAVALGGWAETNPAGRVSTYAYVAFDQPLDAAERDRLAVYLARSYTSDYIISGDRGLVARVADFETVRHAVALEGAATIIGPTREHSELPTFLKTFKENTFRQHYVPIALLALHEHAFFVAKTSASVIPKNTVDDADKTIRIFQDLIEASLLFRLCFRFSELSYITMHNSVSRAFREALRLDQMLSQLATDILDAESHVRRVYNRKLELLNEERDRKFYWISVMGVSALTFLTADTIFKELINVIGNAMYPSAETIVDKVGHVTGLFVGGCAFAVAFVLGMFNRPKASDPHDRSGRWTLHAMLENMINKANKGV